MSDRLAYALGVYVQELRERAGGIRRLIAENDPWPDSLHPKPDYYAGQLSVLSDVIGFLDAVGGSS